MCICHTSIQCARGDPPMRQVHSKFVAHQFDGVLRICKLQENCSSRPRAHTVTYLGPRARSLTWDLVHGHLLGISILFEQLLFQVLLESARLFITGTSR